MKDRVRLRMDLRCLRKQAKLSIDKVVELSGLSHSTVSRIEQGKPVTLENALCYAQFLHLPVEDIWKLGESGTKEKK